MGIAKKLQAAVDDKKITEAQADAAFPEVKPKEEQKLIDKTGQGLLFAAGPVKVQKKKLF